MTGGEHLAGLAAGLRHHLDAAHAARETAIGACRRTIRACGSSIRAVHRLEPAEALSLADEAEASLRQAQHALGPFPALAATGPLHDAEKEYAEARLTAALVEGGDLPSFTELAVGASSWLGGLAEAATELRRHLLDRLRAGDLDHASRLLTAMDDVYGLLMSMDYPDAVTGGLRRQVDALRAVLERTRGDLTTTVLQARLQAAIESRTNPPVE
ncbi:MAG: haloacid dehalogenase [Actinomycetota bacterium]|jgi:translin